MANPRLCKICGSTPPQAPPHANTHFVFMPTSMPAPPERHLHTQTHTLFSCLRACQHPQKGTFTTQTYTFIKLSTHTHTLTAMPEGTTR